MDGTLVDTEPYWIEVEFELAATYGGTWSREHALNLVGNDLLSSGRYIREHMGIDVDPAAIVELLLDGVVERVERRVPWQPGAVELLANLKHAGVPCALVAMSYERFVAPILAIEDSDTGTSSAVAAGRAVLVVPHHVEVPPGEGRTFVDSLVGLDVARVWSSVRAI